MFGKLSDVLAAIDQQVEGVESEVRALLSFRVDWSSWKSGLALGRSSATASPSIRQPAGRLAAALTSGPKLVAPVLAVAGPGGRGAVAGGDQQPVAVIFIFVDPVGAGRHRVDQGRQLRRLERRRRLARFLLARGRPSARRGSSARRPRPTRSRPSSGRS